MKRAALLLLLAFAATACSNATTRGGARGPTIQRAQASQPETAGALDGRADLGQRSAD